MRKYLQIDFLEYAHQNTYVLLKPSFRKRLMNIAAKKAGTNRKLAGLIDSNRGTIINWKTNTKYNKRRMPLKKILKCCEISGISNDVLRKNIKSATLRYPAGNIYIKNWRVSFDERFAEWFGLLNGDGSVSDRDVSFTNTYHNLTFYFADFFRENIWNS